jgi:hypothetical protein
VYHHKNACFEGANPRLVEKYQKNIRFQFENFVNNLMKITDVRLKMFAFYKNWQVILKGIFHKGPFQFIMKLSVSGVFLHFHKAMNYNKYLSSPTQVQIWL